MSELHRFRNLELTSLRGLMVCISDFSILATGIPSQPVRLSLLCITVSCDVSAMLFSDCLRGRAFNALPVLCLALQRHAACCGPVCFANAFLDVYSSDMLCTSWHTRLFYLRLVMVAQGCHDEKYSVFGEVLTGEAQASV